ncbi:NUDIX domain-containing protein [Candidatus Saccharibacteria bacterium]|nr:NUDIX domain-containing protein [Candidatus Saccharibacteria bacterium]
MKIDRHLSWVLLHQGDQVLLVRQKRGFGRGKLSGVGGKQKAGESIEECAIRETKEEIGVKIRDFRLAGRIIFDNLFYAGKPERVMMHCYIAESWTGKIRESDEAAPQWLKASEIDYSQLWDDDQYWLPLVLCGKRIEAYFHYLPDNSFDRYWVAELPEKLISDLDDAKLGLAPAPTAAGVDFCIKEGARAVLLDDKNRVALIHATRRGWYKLPGGGCEYGELIAETLLREVREETGYEAEIIQPLGYGLTRRNRWQMIGKADCYLCRAGEFHGAEAMPDEIADGDQLEWFDDFDAAIATLQTVKLDEIGYYGAYFFTQREIDFLKYAKQITQEK